MFRLLCAAAEALQHSRFFTRLGGAPLHMHVRVHTRGTQVYGGSKYRHDPALDRMRPGEFVRRAVPYGDYLRGKAGGSGGAAGVSGADATSSSPDRLVPFRMGPIQAAEQVKQSIRWAGVRCTHVC